MDARGSPRHAVTTWALAGALVLAAAACSDGDDDPVAASTTSTTATTTSATTAATTTPTTTPTTSTTPNAPDASFPDDATAVTAITASFQYPGSPLTPDEAHCIGDGLVHVFGHARAAALGFGAVAWPQVRATDGRDWADADRTAIVATLRVCTPSWEQLAEGG